jgi:anaerobic carbon-monoxide dehydrogenase iron sulfur subunit
LFGAIAEAIPPPPRITIRRSKDKKWSIPIKCRHCNPAPCFASCPTGAIERDIMTGCILINEHKCIACKRCLQACPFGVIQFGLNNKSEKRHIVAQKCDECSGKTLNGDVPACVAACTTEALIYTDSNDDVNELKKSAFMHISGLSPEAGDSPCDFTTFFSLKNRNEPAT